MAFAGLQIPTTLGHYRIAEKIGEGGMGEVYRARDERLQRDVAIKLLPAGAIADETARKRFRKEALALSKLNHPNIETIHDFDSDSSLDFIVTEYVAGEGLDKKLAHGRLGEDKIVRYGLQLAEGLSAAHAEGIIHRDLKPANIHITPDERLKILDFGLAKLTTGDFDAVTASQSEQTRFAGTLPYMSPEQVKGEAVDARADIWAVGCVLYEMATGRRAFPSPGLQVAEEILHLHSAAPSSVNAGISPALDAVVLKCLEKIPSDRYQSARDLGEDLRRLQTGTPSAALEAVRKTKRRLQAKVAVAAVVAIAAIGIVLTVNLGRLRQRMLGPSAPRITSIAVLPLENLSGDPQQEYFADGVTESLISNLGMLTGLKKVMSRPAVMRFKATKKSPQEIARELKVDALISGSVLRSSNQVRVAVQLISPEGNQLWAGTYQRPVTDILRLQTQITAAIASELRVKLTADQQARFASVRPVNAEAYDAYLLGRYHKYKLTAEGFQKALEYYQLALDKDPNYTPALFGIAEVWHIREDLNQVGRGEGYSKMKDVLAKVLQADNTSAEAQAEAHRMLAFQLAWSEWNWDAILKDLELGVKKNPNDADGHFIYSLMLYAMRRFDDARTEMDLALDLDPYNAYIRGWSAHQLIDQSRLDEALLELDRVATLDPERPQVHFIRFRAYHRKGQYEQALEHLKNLYSTDPEVVGALERGYASGGYKLGLISAADAAVAKGKKVNREWAAQIYAAAGADESALDCLESAFNAGRRPVMYANAQGEFEHLRSNPRLQALMRRMNLAD